MPDDQNKPAKIPDNIVPITQKRRYFLRKVEAGLFSGLRLAEIDPERFALVQRLLADGVLSRRQIASAAAVSPNTVRAIDEQQTGTIDACRARLISMCSKLQVTTLDRIQEALEDDDPKIKLGIRDLAAILRELGDRADRLEGRPTSIVATASESITDLVQANAERRARFRQLQQSILTTATETPAPSPAQTRFDAEERGPREGARPALGGHGGGSEGAATGNV